MFIGYVLFFGYYWVSPSDLFWPVISSISNLKNIKIGVFLLLTQIISFCSQNQEELE